MEATIESYIAKNFKNIKITPNGAFLARRYKHLHTGIDMFNMGPGEKVYAAAAGQVVSIYAREPHRAVMIQHQLKSGKTIYTVYVHITNVKVEIGDWVSTDTVIACLMNKKQLLKYGDDFNHLHFEVLKYPRENESGKIFSYSTRCRTKQEVEKYFLNPINFLEKVWAQE